MIQSGFHNFAYVTTAVTWPLFLQKEPHTDSQNWDYDTRFVKWVTGPWLALTGINACFYMKLNTVIETGRKTSQIAIFMGLTWVLSAPGGPHVGPMNLVIRDAYVNTVLAIGLSSTNECADSQHLFNRRGGDLTCQHYTFRRSKGRACGKWT